MIETAERAQTCRDRIGKLEEKLAEIRTLMDELITPNDKEGEHKDTDDVITSLEVRLELLNNKADCILDQLQRLSKRI
jgi:predicted nuclease with TOPRIM domain